MNCMILAPHQDDELILCGSFINRIKSKGYEIFIVFTTNGDYNKQVENIRLEESLKVAQIYGIPEENIIFLGYANEYDPGCKHIYNATEGEKVISQYGRTETQGLKNHPEFCFVRHGVHHVFTRSNFLNDLNEIITEIRPELIFSTGEEIHPDHSANSLFLDEVLGKIMRKDEGYHPTVYKKPEYNTAWFGERDYSDENNKMAEFDYRTQNVCLNGNAAWFYDPYIRWNNRIRIPVDRGYELKLKEALYAYDSQNAIDHFDMLANSDVVFWQRRTDSLTYSAEITTSSGEACFLNDFKRNDSRDIRRQDTQIWNQNASIWRPEKEDKNPMIKINLKKRTQIESIVIYQEYCPKAPIYECSIFTDETEVWRGCLRTRKETKLNFEPVITKEITIKIEKYKKCEAQPGISEIEVFQSNNPKVKFIKTTINNNFVYDYKYAENERQKFGIYVVYENGETKMLRPDDCSVQVFDGSKEIELQSVFDEKWNLILSDRIDNLRIRTEYKDKCFDEITVIYPKKKEGNNIYLIGTPNHYNSGDHFIAEAARLFLEELFPKKEIKEIQISDFEKTFSELKKEITRNDLIVLQGGGNMGNVYPLNEDIRRRVLKTFSNIPTVIFPETIYYTKDEEGAYDEHASEKIYKGSKRLTICAREEESYKKMKALYPNANILLTPDIVCSMRFITLPKTENTASLFFRSDGEKSISLKLQKKIEKALHNKGFDYKYRDMIYNKYKGYAGKANRKLILERKTKEIAESSLVFTDRLHAMILCVMTGTPCIVICGYNHKIPSAYETWFKNVSYVHMYKKDEDLELLIDKMTNIVIDVEEVRKQLNNSFEELRKYLRGMIND